MLEKAGLAPAFFVGIARGAIRAGSPLRIGESSIAAG